MKKKMDGVKCRFCAALVCMALTGCGVWEILDEVPRDFGLRQETEEAISEENDTRIVSLEDILAIPQSREGDMGRDAEEWFLMEEAYPYAFDGLSASEQSWYRDIEQLLGSYGEKTELNREGLALLDSGEADEAVDRVFRCVLNDHPEIFYVDGYSCTKYMRGDRIVSVEFAGTYTMDRETALERKAAIEESAGILLEGIDEDASDYEKVKYVYDVIIRGTDYDLDAADSQNIYSVFVNHSSVCQGYAKATQYLLNRLGIECTLVLGTVDTGEGHAWNLVKADGAYYYVDTTWGDVSYQEDLEDREEAGDGNPNEAEDVRVWDMPEINYDYLNVTTEELFRTHFVGGAVSMPLCTATEANYYRKEGAYFTSYDREQLAELFERAKEQGQSSISIKCADEECYHEILEILIEEHGIFDFLEKREGSVAYAQNEKQLSLTFWVTNE